jgi:outer membrane protein
MKRLWLAFAALALAAGLAAAEMPLTIDEAVSQAKEHNLGLERERIGVAAARRAVDNAWNAYLPGISVSTGLGRSGYSASGENWSAWASLNLGLSLSGSLFQTAQRTRLAYESQSIGFQKAERALELSVRKAFYALLLSEDRVNLARQKLERAQQRLEETTKKYRAGLVPELDVLSARVACEGLKPDLESAATDRANGLDGFKLLLGLETGEELALRGSLEEIARRITMDAVSAKVAELAGKETLDALALAKSLQIAQSKKRAREMDNVLPSLSVSLAVRPTLSNWSSGPSFLDMGSSSLSLTMDIADLIPGSSARTAIAELDDSIKKIESELAEQRLELATSAQLCLRSIATAESALGAYAGNIDLASKTYDLTYEAYQRGYKSLSDLENASASLDEARVARLAESYNLIAAALDLEYTLDLDFNTFAR